MDYFSLLKVLSNGLTMDQWREELFTVIRGGRENEIDLSGNDPFEYLKGLFSRTPDPAMARDQFGQALQEVLKIYSFAEVEIENERGYKAIRYLLRFVLEYQNYTTVNKIVGLLKILAGRVISEDYSAGDNQLHLFSRTITYCIDTIGRYFPEGMTYQQAKNSGNRSLFDPDLILLANYLKLCRKLLISKDNEVVAASLNYLFLYGVSFDEAELQTVLENAEIVKSVLSDFVWADAPENYRHFVELSLKREARSVIDFLLIKGCKMQDEPELDEDEKYLFWNCVLPTNETIRLKIAQTDYLDSYKPAKRDKQLPEDSSYWKNEGQSDSLNALINNTEIYRLLL
jgi:hypothetical protein